MLITFFVPLFKEEKKRSDLSARARFCINLFIAIGNVEFWPCVFVSVSLYYMSHRLEWWLVYGSTTLSALLMGPMHSAWCKHTFLNCWSRYPRCRWRLHLSTIKFVGIFVTNGIDEWRATFFILLRIFFDSLFFNSSPSTTIFPIWFDTHF